MSGPEPFQPRPLKFESFDAVFDAVNDVSEYNLSEKFLESIEYKIRFNIDTNQWYYWNNTLWVNDRLHIISNRCRDFLLQWSNVEGNYNSYALDRHLRMNLCRLSTLKAVMRLVQMDQRVAVTSDCFDTDPQLLGTPDGVIDLKTGTFRQARPEDMISRATAVAPAAVDAPAPLWIAFLTEATGDDLELMTFLQVMAGYALTGLTRSQCLFFLFGSGGNGKSVFVNTLVNIMKDYASVAAIDTFTAKRQDSHPEELARLQHARLVIATETERGRNWAESRIKSLTGSDPITARFMHCNSFTYTPSFKLVISGNHQPALTSVDEAMRRRIKIVPFTRQPQQRDEALEDKLRAEWPAILRWAIEGARRYFEDGLPGSAAIEAITRSYLCEEDRLQQWLDEHCDVDPDRPLKEASASRLFASGQALFKSWQLFCEGQGERAGTQQQLMKDLRRRGFIDHRKSGGRGLAGLQLKQSDQDARQLKIVSL